MGYPGGKSGPGVYHRLINLMPPHAVYCEPFLGGGAVMRLKWPAAYNIGVDLDAGVIRNWRSRVGVSGYVGSPAASGSARGNADPAGGIGRCADAAEKANPPSRDRGGGNADHRSISNLVGPANPPSGAIRTSQAFPPTSAETGENADRRHSRGGAGRAADPRRRRAVESPISDRLDPKQVNPPTGAIFRFLRGDALTFLASYPFQPEDLIYCDPPYLMETRSSGRLYRHEFSDEQHAELLSTIGELPCRVMISGYWSELYAFRLSRWNSIHFEAMTRGGMATEWLWFNFEPPTALHDYRYLGESAHQRQDLKRMVKSWTGKLARMPLLKKQALLSAISSIGGNDARIRP